MMDKRINEMVDASLIEDLVDGCPKSASDLEKLPLHSILLVLGGYIAIGIGSFHFVITIMRDFYLHSIFHLLINLLSGFGLLFSYHRIKAKKMIKKWAFIAAIFSVILIALGGIVGALAGLVGATGAILALLTVFNESWDI